MFEPLKFDCTYIATLEPTNKVVWVYLLALLSLFAKGEKFYDFLFASLGDEILKKGNLASLKERIRKIKLAELLPPRVYIQVHSSILKFLAAFA